MLNETRRRTRRPVEKKFAGTALAEIEADGSFCGYATLFAVSNNDTFFRRLGYAERHVPELDRERSAVSRFKGVYAKDL